MLLALAALANAVYCSQAAFETGRNPFLWFAIGLLFGPLALVAVMRWPREE